MMNNRIDIVRKGLAYKRGDKLSAEAQVDLSLIAHPMDKSIISKLEAVHLADALNDAFDELVSASSGMDLATGIAVDEINFPEIHKMLLDIASMLGIEVPYTVVSSSMSGINAYATGTDRRPFVVISNQVPALVRPEEVKFLLGHECGHIAMEHMVYHTAVTLASSLGAYVPVVGPLIASTVTFPLKYWSRCSEITADRAGLLACGDLTTAQRALLRIVGGLTSVDDVDIDRYIAQSRRIQDIQFLGRFNEYFADHPLIYKRLRALEAFTKSEPYYTATGKIVPEGVELLSKQQLDENVSDILRVI